MLNKFQIIFLIAGVFTSCTYETDKKKSILNSTRIIILEKKLLTSDLNETYSLYTKAYDAKTDEQLNLFRNFFAKADSIGYHYSSQEDFHILFYHHNTLVGYYYLDTSDLIDKVTIYEDSYQSSFVIDKKMWLRFLNKTFSADYVNGL